MAEVTVTDNAAGAPAAGVPQPQSATADHATAKPVRHPTHDRSAVRARAKSRARRRVGRGLGARIFLILLALGLVLGGLGLSGRSISFPVWAVAEVEARLNGALAEALPQGSVSVGAIDVMVDADWVPRLRLQDLRLLRPGGRAILTLPDTRLTLDARALLSGTFRAQSVRVIGARVAIRRDAAGQFDLTFGAGSGGPRITSLAGLFDAADRLFAAPALADLLTVEAEALSLSLSDARTGQTWEVGDGRLSLANRKTELAAELSLSLMGNAATPARVVLTVVSEKNAGRARLTAQVDQVAAADLAAKTPVLGWLGVLDAPISGSLAASIDSGGLAALEGRLDLGKGALRPSPNTSPIAFDKVSLGIGYDPGAGRILLTGVNVESRSLRLAASGHAYLVNDKGQPITGPLSGRIPAAFVGQLAMTDVGIDPEGLFQAPLKFAQGALDVRLRLNPFVLDIGQMSLTAPDRRLSLKGRIGAEPGGWRTALDLTLDRASRDGLLRLWPLTAVPPTRAWIERNLLDGLLTDVAASFRTGPGSEPRLHLGYSFAEARLRVLPTLPPIEDAVGYATVEAQTYTLVLTKGRVTPPEGGAIEAGGSVFAVPDMTAKPASARMRLVTSSSLTAMLSLLDQPPFGFMTKAQMPVGLGQGTAQMETRMTMPLGRKLTLADVDYTVTGTISDFTSDVLVPGKVITAPILSMSATPQGMTVAGPGLIGAVPFDVTLTQGFAPPSAGPAPVPPGPGPDIPAQIDGTITLSPVAVAEFGMGLPDGMVTGAGPAQVSVTVPRGEPARLVLVSDLNRIGMTIPELGWTKPPGVRGRLEAQVRLGALPVIEKLSLSGAGLEAEGSVTLRPGAGLDVARFSRVRLDGWLDAAVEITGRGAGRSVGLAVTEGVVDLRRLPEQRGSPEGSGGSPLTLTLDRLQVADSIALTRFRGAFSLSGGLNGDFRADVNGEAPITGSVAPAKGGTAVRIRAKDAGQVMAATGIFASARGGTLDLQLIPRKTPGHYDGRADIANIRVRDANVLAELLNAISVVGILDQLNGEGIVFNEADADFVLTPDAIQVTRGAAIGASLGVSMAGLYSTADKRLQLQGVISPIYLVNGIGALFSQRGEGLFGFNYALGGTADAPEVSVNPLSILTPGMFREIFRRPAPILQSTTTEPAIGFAAPEQDSVRRPKVRRGEDR